LNVDALFVPVVLSFTVLASVAFGILAAYLVVTSILQSFGRTTLATHSPRPARLVLVPTQHHASGD
jgi:hypothetical protein